MSSPIHDLQDRLHKLKENRGIIEHSLKSEIVRLELINADILKYEDAINLIKGE